MWNIKKVIGLMTAPILCGGPIVCVVSCAHDTPEDGLIINSDNCAKYLVGDSTPVYTTNSSVVYHNTMLDLSTMVKDVNYVGNRFIIDGEIPFGILVGFAQDVQLFGRNGAIINLENQTDYTYGILIGSTVQPEEPMSYSATLTIDSSVFINIEANDAGTPLFLYGICFGGVLDASITIECLIYITTSNGEALGINFNGGITNSTLLIGGSIVINSYTEANVIIFNSSISATDITINGVYSAAAMNACGVSFVESFDGSLYTNGVFYIMGDNYVCGIMFNKSIVSQSATMHISGVFTVYCTYTAEVGWFEANGIQFGAPLGDYVNVACDVTVDGVFAICAQKPCALYIHGNVSGTLTITANCLVYDNGSTFHNAWGVAITGTVAEISGVPTFYSNYSDTGYTDGEGWIKKGGTEKWNGDDCSTSNPTTTGDDKLEFEMVSSESDVVYSLMLIGADGKGDASKSSYNSLVKTTLTNYVDQATNIPSKAIDWIKFIIQKIVVSSK